MTSSYKQDVGAGIIVGVALTTLLLGVFIGGPLLWKTTKVWRLEQDGKAKLAEAVSSTKAKTERARADYESSKLEAKAEVERAKGTAKAVKIENGAITDSYTQYLFVKNLHHSKHVIYVPTETGLPILEASKR